MKKTPKNIPTYYNFPGTPIFRDTTALPFGLGGPTNNPVLPTIPARTIDTNINPTIEPFVVPSFSNFDKYAGKHYHYDAGTNEYRTTLGDRLNNAKDSIFKPNQPVLLGTEKGSYSFAAGGYAATENNVIDDDKVKGKKIKINDERVPAGLTREATDAEIAAWYAYSSKRNPDFTKDQPYPLQLFVGADWAPDASMGTYYPYGTGTLPGVTSGGANIAGLPWGNSAANALGQPNNGSLKGNSGFPTQIPTQPSSVTAAPGNIKPPASETEWIQNPATGTWFQKETPVAPVNLQEYNLQSGTYAPLPTPNLRYADGGPLNDKTNHGKLLNSVYASALGDYYANGGMLKRADGSYSPRGLWDNIRDNAGSGKEPTPEMLEQGEKINKEYRTGGQFPRPYSLPEDSFKQGGRNLHNSIYASSAAQYPAVYNFGGTLKNNLATRQQMYMPLDHITRTGGSILSMSNTPQLEGEGKDLAYDGGGQLYTYSGRPNAQYQKTANGWTIKTENTNGFVPIKDPTGKRTALLNAEAKPIAGKSTDKNQTSFAHPDAGATDVLFQKPAPKAPAALYNKNAPVDYQSRLKPVVADNTKDVTVDQAVFAKQVNDYMASDEYKAEQKAKKDAQAQFEKEQWDKYNKMSLGEKALDRTNAAINQPLLMAANLVMGDQAYIPGMAEGLGEEGPDYDKWLKATGQERGLGVNDVFNAFNPGNWGGHAGREFAEGNYAQGAAELGLGLLGLKGAPLLGSQLAKSSADNLINLEQKAGQSYNKVGNENFLQNTNALGNELLGALRGKSNKKAVAEGNAWLENWIKHPTTQAKIETDFFPYIARNNQLNDVYDIGLEQAKNFIPQSKEYPLKNQLLDFVKGKEQVHSGNTGVSYIHGDDPIQRLYSIPEENQRYENSWISRQLGVSPTKRASTTIHEGTHDWTSDFLLNASGQKNNILQLMSPERQKLYEEWQQLRMAGKNTNEIMGAENAHKAYLADPTEVHARIMELRKHFQHTPETKTTYKDAEKMMEEINKMKPSKRPVDEEFFEVIEKDPSKLAYLLNRLWATAPIAVSGATLANPWQQEPKGLKY